MNIGRSINNEGNPKRDISDVLGIILHHTGNNSDANKEFLNKTDYISAHYVIQNSGAIWQLMDIDTIGYHCGVSESNLMPSMGNSLNWCTIGIEVVGSKDDFTPEQQDSVFKLCDYLRKKYDLAIIQQHKDIAPDRKIDPDDSLYGLWNNSFAMFREEVFQSGTTYKENGTYIEEINQNTMAEHDYVTMAEDIDNKILSTMTGENPLSEGQTKALINIACDRLEDRLVDKIAEKVLEKFIARLANK